MPKNVQVSDLESGDIVFFAPVGRGDMNVFPELAAFVQAWPYSEDKPWYHVAIATGPGEIIDFAPRGPTADSSILWAEELSARSIRDDSKTNLNVLRINPADANKLASAAKAMIGSSYTEPGLVEFAAVSEARLFKGEDAREKLYNFAAGFEKLAADSGSTIDTEGYTCVTAVTAACARAGVLPNLQVREPDPPSAQPDWISFRNSVVSLYGILKPGSSLQDDVKVHADLGEAPSDAELIEAVTTVLQANTPGGGSLLTASEVRAAYYATGIIRDAPGDLFTYTAQYVSALGDTILALNDKWTVDALVAAGSQLRQGTWPTLGSWALSPAMLYDGLVAAGATSV